MMADLMDHDNEVELRDRQLTEKGAWILNQRIRVYDKLCDELCNYIPSISRSMENENVKDVEDQYRRWISKYSEFTQTGERLKPLLDEHEINVLNNKEDNLKMFKGTVDQFLAKSRQSDRLSDAGSVAGRKSASVISRSSSLQSRTQLLRLEEEQRSAELLARSVALQKKHEIEKEKQRLDEENRKLTEQISLSQQELERQREKLNIETELNVSKARLNVIDQFSQEGVDDVDIAVRKSDIRNNSDNSQDSQLCQSPWQPPATSGGIEFEKPKHFSTPNVHFATDVNTNHAHHNHDPGSEIPHFPQRPMNITNLPTVATQENRMLTGLSSGSGDLSTVISSLADVLSSREEKLPRKEPEVFNGGIFDFPLWLNSYTVLVEQHYPNPSDRIYYLGRYTSGEAKESIKGLLGLGTETGYERAMKLLKDRYGDKLLLTDTYREKIRNWPAVKPGDHKGLRDLSDFLFHCETAMSTLAHLKILDDPSEHKKILSKLPKYIQDKWLCYVDNWIYGSDHGDPAHDGYPPFSRLCLFITKQARIASNPLSLRSPDEKKKEVQKFAKGSNSAKSFASKVDETVQSTVNQTVSNTTSNSPRSQSQPKCFLCKKEHTLEKCTEFKAMTLKDRKEFIKKRGLCWGCLRWGHISKDCKHKKQCTICEKQHPTVLHDNTYKQTPKPAEETDSASSNCVEVKDQLSSNCSHSLIVPVVLYHQSHPENNKMIYALLDDQSDACFISEAVLQEINVTGESIQLKLATVLAEDTIECQKVNGLVVKGIKEDTEIPLPGTYSRNSIPAKRSQIPRIETVKRWPHLSNVANELCPYLKDIEIGLLIGLNCSRAIKPKEVVPGEDDDPYAVHTALGWGVIGMMNESSCSCRFVSSKEGQGQSHFAFRTKVKELSPIEVSKMFELDYNDKDSDAKISIEDTRFLDKMKKGLHVRDDGHFEMPLPFKKDRLQLPNNKEMASKRLGSLKKRLIKDKRFRDDYTQFMTNMLENKYAEKVPPDEIHLDDGSVWYIPHHGVYHPRKNKIRIVFDCSAEYEGEVLNRHLLQGPDLTNNLTGVLCRFRKEYVAFTCDIEAMFHQVGVDKKDRNYLRFLWWEGGQLDIPPTDFRMTVHLFGATSSPGCVNLALKSAATMHEGDFGKEASDFIKNDFYVDDGLKSVPTTEEAIKLIESSDQLCKKAGFNLHKYVSNDKQVLMEIPQSKRGKELQNIDIFKDDLPIENALGVQWNVQSDAFQFRVLLQDKPFTRRGILSSVSSMFDPLGFVAPFLLTGKQILQELCCDKAGWDDPVPEIIKTRWETWRWDLLHLSQMEIPRCHKPADFGDIQLTELHHFSDASLCGYGQCSYLRLIDNKGNVDASIVMAKSRVTPSKPVTVPRLELTAAVTSVKVANFLRNELDYSNVCHYYYTDSKVVLGYISNESRRFHIYVANRVQQIREFTSPSDWTYIDTNTNPADITSRGMSAQELVSSSLWWKGPRFLSTLEYLPSEKEHCELLSDDPEIKKASAFSTQVSSTPMTGMMERFERFSSWFRLKRAIALCLRYKEILKARLHQKTKEPVVSKVGSRSCDSVTVMEMEQAERVILKIVQRQAFPKEIQALQGKDTKVSKTSPTYMLDPFLDENSVVRVGGRIKRAMMPEDTKHPIIIPRKGHLTNLLVDHYHKECKHSGRGITLNTIRLAGYWIIGVKSNVTRHIWKCVPCRKLRGTACGQKMSDLPKDRVEAAPPFTFSAVDCFGPFYIKDKRKTLKRWAVLFTCMASRAIHIEVASTLGTDSFLNAYRRFVCRRGTVQQLRSDRGTNFVGGKNELQSALRELDDSHIASELLKDNCDWVVFNMNVPHASHMGGVWERMIRSARNVISALLQQHGQQLDDELLHTFMTEAEAVVNSRPLTYIDTGSPDSPTPLSPSQLLTLKGKVIQPPPGVFVREDLYCHRRWRRVQYLSNQFWTRWRSEFLPLLQHRGKWNHPQKNLVTNDIVMMIDENLPRCMWPLARIIETHASSDGLVRKVTLQVGRSTYVRPIHKVVLLLNGEVPDGEPNE